MALSRPAESGPIVVANPPGPPMPAVAAAAATLGRVQPWAIFPDGNVNGATSSASFWTVSAAPDPGSRCAGAEATSSAGCDAIAASAAKWWDAGPSALHVSHRRRPGPSALRYCDATAPASRSTSPTLAMAAQRRRSGQDEAFGPGAVNGIAAYVHASLLSTSLADPARCTGMRPLATLCPGPQIAPVRGLPRGSSVDFVHRAAALRQLVGSCAAADESAA